MTALEDTNAHRMLRRSPLSRFLLALARLAPFRRYAKHLALLLEGGELYSSTARTIMEAYYGVRVGAYSYGWARGTTLQPNISIGNYVSIGSDLRVFRRNHPLDRPSAHPFFYNASLGYVSTEDSPRYRALEIAHDVWIGTRVVILPAVSRVGVGAVIGAGSVVTKDVADFEVVGGVPARRIKFRLNEDDRRKLLESEWWLHPPGEAAAIWRRLGLACTANFPFERFAGGTA